MTVTSGIGNFEIFFSVKSGKERRYPAEMAYHRVEIGGKLRALYKNISRSSDVNCCRFALINLIFVCCSVGLLRSVMYIPVIGQHCALRMGLSL